MTPELLGRGATFTVRLPLGRKAPEGPSVETLVAAVQRIVALRSSLAASGT